MLTTRQSIDHFITYSVISAQPELSYSSAVSTIRVYPVTSGQHEGHTFVTWTGNFSSDADASELYLDTIQALSLTQSGVIQDAKFKRREALADLAKAASKK
jgi:hypothetical protein